ncbi:flagellar motor control protein ZomB [Corynebacterium sp. HS2168-gen11]|uniref:flagellar motor control protein ZomB n=1 Tax=Corynebacterium sp. HS2168-gen11 TaxID=2974027 RepID=UPI00216B1470|nr:flagellar motor control protein ZomB [Corynebacterium sp. HS2168-gen11]MCS4535970.1 hypothetical protein [Corynebacterium sp. HS2168-gen11]
MKYARSLPFSSGLLAACTVALVAAYGGWQRRWMSDDGLIVLRTVRNLLAGNGPVFNAGERVEANTSALWQYIIYLGALVNDARLETIATYAALTFTTLAVFLAALGTARLYGGQKVVLLPFGGLLYLALPPARDFATSGLEWGLSLLWISTQWLLLTTWARNERTRGSWALYLLALNSGLSWLVRPELALYGGLSGILLLIVHRQQWWKILAVALPIPAAYQIFRMGYYGLLVPHTAVAKSATGAQWAQGWHYLAEFNQAYNLWIALVIALLAAALAITFGHRGSDADMLVQRKTVWVIFLILTCALLHATYVIRVGGDFMHARMLLLPLYTALLPVSVIALRRLVQSSIITTFVFAAGMVWAGFVVHGGHPYQLPAEGEELDIVDERMFWQLATYRDQPTYWAEDFHTARSLREFLPAVAAGHAQHDAQVVQFLVSEDPIVFSWRPVPRTHEATDLAQMPLSLTMINLGMTSMNAPLDVRVLDTIGLANPLAARSPRLENARVGHDKFLPLEWQFADSAMAIEDLPDWVDPVVTKQARAALYSEELQALFASYRSPLTMQRFFDNIVFSLTSGRTLELHANPRDYENLPKAQEQRIFWPQEISVSPDRR